MGFHNFVSASISTGVRSDCGRVPQLFPNVVHPLPLTYILCPPHPKESPHHLPTGPAARACVADVYKRIARRQPLLLKCDWIVNENVSDTWIDRSTARPLMPALTRGLHQGYWLGSRGRHTTISENARAQGFREHIQWPSNSHALHLLGNTMSMCIVERLLALLMRTIYPRLSVEDPWVTGAGGPLGDPRGTPQITWLVPPMGGP